MVDRIGGRYDSLPESELSMKGLIGLRNLGNTCYMNAALQALSNCPPLREYFRTVPLLMPKDESTSSNDSAYSMMSGAGNGKLVSLEFSNLVTTLWSDTKTHSHVAPAHLLWRVQEKWPQFRGFNQQDSQEFIRCLLDLLHQELRRPIRKFEADCLAESDSLSSSANETCSSVSSSHSSSREDLDNDNDQFETADSGLSSEAEDSPKAKANSRMLDLDASNKSSAESVSAEKIVGYRSIITDVFDGELISSVKCQTCQHISYTKENFQDVSLSIPTIEQLEFMKDAAELEATQSESGETSTSSNVQRTSQLDVSDEEMPSSYISWIYSLASRWLFQPLGNLFYHYYRYMFTGSISLENCLKAFFSADLLHGEDMYSCEKCAKLRNGVKQSELTRLPEILCVHLKRFRHDHVYSGKINTKVTFPLYDLDMRPFVKASTLQKDDQLASEYDLVAIVSHRGGGLDWGHYIAYCRNDLDMNWYEYDDTIVTRVNVLEVMSKEAYVLFYQKKTKSDMEKIRIEGSELIRAAIQGEHLTSKKEVREEMNFISRDYLQKFFTFSDPGPINNFEFLCVHGNIAPSLNGNSPAYVLIDNSVWEFLQQHMGGGPECRVDQVEDCPTCKQTLTQLIQRKLNEFKGFAKADMKTKYCDFLPPHVISKHWLDKWKTFVMQVDAEPPPPINNESLVRKFKDGTSRFRAGCKCFKITREAWLFLHNIYGGGPEVFSVSISQPTPEDVAEMVSKAEDALQAYYESKRASKSEEVVLRPAAPEQSMEADYDVITPEDELKDQKEDSEV